MDNKKLDRDSKRVTLVTDELQSCLPASKEKV
jgi:hypothetical protein